MGGAVFFRAGAWVGLSTSFNVLIPCCMMTISEGAMPGAVEAMGTRVATRGRRRRKGADGAVVDGQEPERSGDSQPQAARRANEVGRCASDLGGGDAVGVAGALGMKEEEEDRGMVAVEEVVVELHVRQGRPLREVARVLGVDAAGMQVLWRRTLAHLAQLAPKEEVDFTAVREQICAALWETVECTFPKAPLPAAPAGKAPELHVGTDGQMELPLRFSLPPAPVLAAEPPSAPMLTVRLRALDQLAKLYDVGLARGASGADAEPDERPYATPPEIAEAVRLRLLEMHGRAGDGSRV